MTGSVKGHFHLLLMAASFGLMAGAGCGGVSGNSGSSAPMTTPTTASGIYYLSNDSPTSLMYLPSSANGAAMATKLLDSRAVGPLSCPNFDTAGNFYALATYSDLTQAIVEFAAGATGSPMPIRTIYGSNTTFSAGGLGILRVNASGQMAVLHPGTPSVAVFSSTASGNVAPTQLILGSNTGLMLYASYLGLDDAGNLYAETTGPQVSVFPAGAMGNVAPSRSISVPNARSAVDSAGNLYVTVFFPKDEVHVYGPTASGITAPIRTIQSTDATYQFDGDLLGKDGSIYVQGFISSTQASAIIRFAPGASGTVTPAATITGLPTLLTADGIALF